MTILSDKEIRGLCVDVENPMITPYVSKQVKNTETGIKIVSYGESSAGYDVRLDRQFQIFTNTNHVLIDPLDFDDSCLVGHIGDYAIIPPNSYILGTTIEYFDVPRDIMVICVGKSTLARVGLGINVTPIEPGFKGNIVIEIANFTSLPVKIYAGQGIAQFLFFRCNPCEVSYDDRKGKYQNQKGITLAKV